MALQKETVAIPFASGIQPNTRARLLDPAKLLVAENCQYIQEQGPQKRNGHVGRVVTTHSPYVDMNGATLPNAAPSRETFSTANPNLSPNWVYGWGFRDSTDIGHGFGSANSPNFGQTPATNEVSPFPDVGQLFGVSSRDDEAVVWDGHRLFSYAPNQASRFGEASNSSSVPGRGPFCAPAMRAGPIAKVTSGQLQPDSCDNGVLRVVAWVNPGGTSYSYSVYDSKSGACLINVRTTALTTIKSLRCICVGPWFHILYSDTGANTFSFKSFHQDNPNTTKLTNLGAVDDNIDVKKINESKFVTLHLKTNTMTVNILNADGTVISTFTPSTAGADVPTTNSPISIGVDSFSNIAVAWFGGAGSPWTMWFRVYTQGGVILATNSNPANYPTLRRITIAPKLIGHFSNPDQNIWIVYTETLVSSVSQVQSLLIFPGEGIVALGATRNRLVLASHAFHVGDRTFVWCASWITGAIGLQTTWFLCDERLEPVGKLAYGQANPDLTGLTYTLKSTNWHTDDVNHPFKDRIVYHGALGYNQRVATASTSAAPNGVFAEPGIIFYQLDFLPRLRGAQAGRTTYFAGAQLWAYDGTEVVEAGFHMAPEGITGVVNAGLGALSAGSYRYRVDLCHKNAQNEEVRSWSIVTQAFTAAATDRITLTIPTMPMTRKAGTYFLIFRTKANDTVFYLVNDRDPAGALFLSNNLNVASVTFADNSSDTTIAAREYHPANAGGNYVDPLPAPACEIVAAGRGRLWLSGGELARGEVAPSRLFQPGETPAFSPALNIQVDRNFEPITAIGFMGDIGVFFRRINAYVIDSDGPDNSFVGTWAPPRLAVADTGCVAQETIALTTVGLWFKSPAGIRLITNSGAMHEQAGIEVDVLTVDGDYSAAVVAPKNTQVRWYSRDISKPSVVLDYSSNTWTTWTGVTCVGAIFWPVSNFAVLGRGDGFLWEEREGVYADNGAGFETRVKLAWLHAANLGDFQRIRRFALFGECAPATALRCRLFYDERPFHDEEFIVTTPPGGDSHFNSSTWGDEAAWGDVGAWGDDSNMTAEFGKSLWFRDGVFKFRHRPSRQKCSVFSVEFSDQAAINSGFVPVVLAIELAKKQGLDRIPTS